VRQLIIYDRQYFNPQNGQIIPANYLKAY